MPKQTNPLTLRERLDRFRDKTYLLRNFRQNTSELQGFLLQTLIADALVTLVEKGEARVAQTGSTKPAKKAKD